MFNPSLTDANATQASSDVKPATPKKTVYWPGDLLPHAVPNAKIYSYGYDADVIKMAFQAAGKNSISEHGQNFMVELERHLDSQNPIIFVAHSLGGIVVKDVLRRAKTNLLPQFQRLHQRTRCVVFLGTPHRGSGKAGWGQIASNLAACALMDANKALLEGLAVNSEILESIHAEFMKIVYSDDLLIHSFQEGKGLSGLNGFGGKVVEDYSSKLDYPLEVVESLDANHMQMARFHGPTDPNYQKVSRTLVNYVARTQAPISSPDGGLAGLIVESNDFRLEKSTKYIFDVPFSRNVDFTGREDVVAKAESALAPGPSHLRVALVGLGGVGKTQIALEYAHRCPKNGRSALWIHASNRARFEDDYRRIAKLLEVPGVEDPKANVLLLLKEWLSDNRSGQWLMVVDNADDADIFFARQPADISLETGGGSHNPLFFYLPQSPNVSILFTTRDKRAAVKLTNRGRIIMVLPMSPEEAQNLLHRSLQEDEWDGSVAEDLLEALDHLPLAIAQAAAYMTECSLAMPLYLQHLHRGDTAVMELLSHNFQDLRRRAEVPNAVMATWQITFDHLKKHHQRSASVLALMSILDRQRIPKSILSVPEETPAALETVLGRLKAFSLVSSDRQGENYDMHRLVQLATRHWLTTHKELQGSKRVAFTVLSEQFPGGEYLYDRWEECQVLLPHSLALGKLDHSADSDSDLLMRATLLDCSAHYLYEIGQYASAYSMQEEAFAIRKRLLGEDDPVTLQSMTRLGMILFCLCEHQRAEERYLRAIDGRKKVLGEDHPHTLESQSNLAVLFDFTGRHEESKELNEKVLEARSLVLGSGNIDTLLSLSNLQVAFVNLNNLERAEQLSRDVLARRRKSLGDDHPHTLLSMANLGNILRRRGDFQVADALLQKSLQGHQKLYGEHYLFTTLVLYQVAYLRADQGRIVEAEEIMAKTASNVGAEQQMTVIMRNTLERHLKNARRFLRG